MASRRQRDEWAAFLRRGADRLGRRLGEPVRRWLSRKLPSSKVLFTIGVPVFLLGVLMLPAWRLVGWVGGPRLATTELPFGDLKDVAVDSRGRIYVADSLYSRVQRYSPEGEFQRGWFVPTSGVFALRTTADDRVQVATARANKLLTYDGDGNLLDGQYRMKEDRYWEFASEAETTGPYAVRRGLLPHVIDTRTGRAVVDTPWPKRLLGVPFPALLYALIGAAFVAAGAWRSRYEPKPPPGEKGPADDVAGFFESLPTPPARE